jgi:Protein of unknown function (DUF4058)
MPVHDWTRVDAGLFHAFHHRWIDAICDALNAGILPSDYFALPEQRIRGPIPDVLTLRLPASKRKPKGDAGGVATAPSPVARFVRREEKTIYANKASRLAVRHRHGDVVAVIEIVSPGNKASVAECRSFVTKAADLLIQEVNLLVIDLFPFGRHDPVRLSTEIWEEIASKESDGNPPGELPADEPLTLASYDAGPEKVVYAESVAVGKPLPDMPIFLRPEFHVMVPLDRTYQTTWQLFPDPLKELLEDPA